MLLLSAIQSNQIIFVLKVLRKHILLADDLYLLLIFHANPVIFINERLGDERVNLPLCKVADASMKVMSFSL